MFNAKSKETGETIGMTEDQVRSIIIFDLQIDMAAVSELSDEEIAAGVEASNIDDYFHNGSYENGDYEITPA